MSLSASRSQEAQTLSGILLVVIATLGFSAKAILVKLGYRYGVDAITLLVLRMIFSLPFFLFVAAVNQSNNDHRLEPKDWGAVVVLGFFGYYLASLLDFYGLQYVTVGLERLILYLYPTIAVILSALFLHRRATRAELLAIGLSYLGIAIATHGAIGLRANGYLGVALIFGSAVSYAVYIVGSERTIHRIGAIRCTAYALTISCLLVIGQYGFSHRWQLPKVPMEVYALSLGMAIFSTVVPAFLMSAGIKRIGANKTVIIGGIGPIATIAMGVVVLGEEIGVAEVIGTALVLTGVVNMGRKHKVIEQASAQT